MPADRLLPLPTHDQPSSFAVRPANAEFVTQAPAGLQRLEVQVTAASGNSVYLDKGRTDGIQPGDEVILFPIGRPTVNAAIQNVSRTNCRCSVLSGTTAIDVGTRGEVLIPADRLQQSSESNPPLDSRPDHPPWTRPPDNWSQDQPLLAPAYSQAPDERTPSFHGRMYIQYLHTWNQNYYDNQYSLGRTGTALWYENPFRQGGTLHLQGEFNRRGVFLEDVENQFSEPGRLDRVSYVRGDSVDDPWRFEAGRFLSQDIPEYGIVDGAEVRYQISPRLRIGVSAGLLPQPFPNLRLTDDLHIGPYCRWTANDAETFSTTLAYQNTWYHGTPDRDLMIYSASFVPGPQLSVYGTVWGDFFNRQDNLESVPFEISQAVIQPVWRIDSSRGVGVNASYVRWPQLLRLDYDPFLPIQVRRDRTFRCGLFGWQELGERLRLDGRIGFWNDQSHSQGTTWEGRVTWREVIGSHNDMMLSIFGADGRYSNGPGGRLAISRQWPWCYATAIYEMADYTLVGKGFGSVQQAAGMRLDFSLPSGQSISASGTFRFGPHQDALESGIYYQKRL